METADVERTATAMCVIRVKRDETRVPKESKRSPRLDRFAEYARVVCGGSKGESVKVGMSPNFTAKVPVWEWVVPEGKPTAK